MIASPLLPPPSITRPRAGPDTATPLNVTSPPVAFTAGGVNPQAGHACDTDPWRIVIVAVSWVSSAARPVETPFAVTDTVVPTSVT